MAEKDTRVGNVPKKQKVRDRAIQKEVITPPDAPSSDPAYVQKRIGNTDD